jgi:hypothetical protein
VSLERNENRTNQVFVPLLSAAGVSMAFVVQSGEGTLSAPSRTTNPGGQATVGFTMGALSTTVRADVTDAERGRERFLTKVW